MESYRQFSQVCALGDLTKVAKFVDLEPRTQQYLNEGLCAAIYKKDVRIVELLISKVATIDPDVANAAATTKLLPIFQLLLEHGWDINAPVLGSLNHPDVRQSSRLYFLEHLSTLRDVLCSN